MILTDWDVECSKGTRTVVVICSSNKFIPVLVLHRFIVQWYEVNIYLSAVLR